MTRVSGAGQGPIRHVRAGPPRRRGKFFDVLPGNGEETAYSGQSSWTSPLRFRTRTARFTTVSSRSFRAISS